MMDIRYTRCFCAVEGAYAGKKLGVCNYRERDEAEGVPGKFQRVNPDRSKGSFDIRQTPVPGSLQYLCNFLRCKFENSPLFGY